MTISFRHINLDYLDTMTGGDAETMQQMLVMLIEEIPTEFNKMQKALAVKDWEEIFQISHKLKMTLAFIGHKEMISINKALEHCTRNKDGLDGVPPMVEQLVALSKPSVAELKKAARL